ncbi:hypothetical protein BDY21DRAFT_186455 [Lineolata rhizophorae]|uniref:Uncharacterized protein n=1 Tax=Lineolata rhizophorae TaxID=578093 RepID=A0A6A6P8M7_9PEZI|nr:hypothetical protein BDY21DRAFT_186455 [Lineolata rhizophorae]
MYTVAGLQSPCALSIADLLKPARGNHPFVSHRFVYNCFARRRFVCHCFVRHRFVCRCCLRIRQALPRANPSLASNSSAVGLNFLICTLRWSWIFAHPQGHFGGIRLPGKQVTIPERRFYHVDNQLKVDKQRDAPLGTKGESQGCFGSIVGRSVLS